MDLNFLMVYGKLNLMKFGVSNWHNWSLRHNENKVFYFISVPYKSTDLQVSETL